MVAATYADAGSVDYLWYISDDKKEVHFYERYKDADACLEHGATFAKFGERFMSCITWDAFWVFGDLDKDPESAGGKFRAILEPMKAQFFVGCDKLQRSGRSFWSTGR